MKYGYMPGFGKDKKTQIVFARKNFDFIEITNPCPVNFPALGHMHWKIDLSTNSTKEIAKARQYIREFMAMGAKKVTIHPSANDSLPEKEVIMNNINAITRINHACGKTKLLVENTLHRPFCYAKTIELLCSKINGLGVTLDMGHAYKTSTKELDKFLALGKRIKHVHLHDVRNGKDHLFFKSKTKIKGLIKKLQEAGYNDTVTLEMFYVFKGNKAVDAIGANRRDLLKKQIEWLR